MSENNKRYTRNTHNFNNETREWEETDYRKDLSYVDYPETHGLGIHALENGKWSSLYEIGYENKIYCDQWGGPNPTKEQILEDLEKLEKLGLVKSKSI